MTGDLNETSLPLWSATAPPTPDHPALTDDVSADVVVIGAGFTGLRAALGLAEAGASVVVLDSGGIAAGASGRTGGQVNPMLPFNTPDRLRALLPNPYYERVVEAALGSADELFALTARLGIDCEARQKGWLRVNHNAAALEFAKATVSAWNEFGAGMRIIGGEELAALAGTRAYATGTVTPRGGTVQPLRLAQGVAQAALDRGAAIHGHSPVRRLTRQGQRWVAETDRGRVSAECAIVATNGYSDDLVRGLGQSIIALTPIQIATDPLPEGVIGPILPEGHTISDSRRIIMYARREPDGRIVYGGLGRRAADGSVGGFDWLIEDARRVFPGLAGAPWTYRWGGRIALTDDHLPHLHEPAPGLLVGLGYNGRGVAMSHVMGRVLAERALGAAPETLTFPVRDIRGFSMGFVKRLGLGTAVWYMRLRDRMETA